jgi:LPXTG-motif cell wall-anchored protein
VTNENVKLQQGSKQPMDAEKSSDGLTWTITATNNPGVELPSTGGPGTRFFTILGTALIAGAGILLWMSRKSADFTK